MIPLITTSNDGDGLETRIPIARTGTNETPSFEVREELGAVALTIVKNDANTRVADGTDFGDVDVATGAQLTVSIVQPANSSEPPLFTGTQRVQVIGTHAGDFSVTQHLPVSQSVGALLFTIHFDPRDRVCVRAIVEIPNNLIGNAIAAPTKNKTLRVRV